MKVKIFTVITFLLAGIVVLFSIAKGEKSSKEEYAGYLELARSNAEQEIPYIAVQNYLRAINVDASDEAVYKEYIEQAKNLGEDYYMKAVKDYVVYFPESASAYELLCEYYFEQKLYQFVMDTALEAKEKGIATDKVRDYYLECSVMYRVISAGFNEASSFLGETAKVKVEELYGYINNSGGYAIIPKYENAFFFLQTFAPVCEEGEWYMINESGYKVAVPSVSVEYLGVLNNNRILYGIDGKYDYMTSDMVVTDDARFDDATNFKNGVAAVKKNDKWALINSNLEMITDYIFDDVLRDEFNSCINNGVIFAKEDGKYYMVDATGARITDTVFDNAYPFVGSEPAAVCIDGKWGFVDNVGNIIIEPQYQDAKSFNIGLGAVCIDGKWGFVDTSNAIRIECEFVDCLPFSSNGITAICEEDGSWTYIKLLSYVG